MGASLYGICPKCGHDLQILQDAGSRTYPCPFCGWYAAVRYESNGGKFLDVDMAERKMFGGHGVVCTGKHFYRKKDYNDKLPQNMFDTQDANHGVCYETWNKLGEKLRLRITANGFRTKDYFGDTVKTFDYIWSIPLADTLFGVAPTLGERGTALGRYLVGRTNEDCHGGSLGIHDIMFTDEGAYLPMNVNHYPSTPHILLPAEVMYSTKVPFTYYKIAKEFEPYLYIMNSIGAFNLLVFAVRTRDRDEDDDIFSRCMGFNADCKIDHIKEYTDDFTDISGFYRLLSETKHHLSCVYGLESLSIFHGCGIELSYNIYEAHKFIDTCDQALEFNRVVIAENFSRIEHIPFSIEHIYDHDFDYLYISEAQLAKHVYSKSYNDGRKTELYKRIDLELECPHKWYVAKTCDTNSDTCESRISGDFDSLLYYFKRFYRHFIITEMHDKNPYQTWEFEGVFDSKSYSYGSKDGGKVIDTISPDSISDAIWKAFAAFDENAVPYDDATPCEISSNDTTCGESTFTLSDINEFMVPEPTQESVPAQVPMFVSAFTQDETSLSPSESEYTRSSPFDMFLKKD